MSSPAPTAFLPTEAREHTPRPLTPPPNSSLVDSGDDPAHADRPVTPPSSTPSAMEDVQATPTHSESAVADYLVSPGHDELHPILLPDLTPQKTASIRRSSTPTPRGIDSIVPAVATPINKLSRSVPDTPTSPGHDVAHAILVQESDAEGSSASTASDSEDDDIVFVQGSQTSLTQVAQQVQSAPASQPAQWLSCVEHRQVPTQPLKVNRAFTSAKWYLVIRGSFVGVFPFSYWADNATKRVKHSASVCRTCLQSDAVEEFNMALAAGLVQIV